MPARGSRQQAVERPEQSGEPLNTDSPHFDDDATADLP
jgi:hypothetical protein